MGPSVVLLHLRDACKLYFYQSKSQLYNLCRKRLFPTIEMRFIKTFILLPRPAVII